MTEEMETRIKTMREGGLGYVKIAKALGISENTVRSYCQRHGLQKGTEEQHLCLYCGKPVRQDPKRKEKKFCSDVCRMKWWHEHPENMNRRATYELVCQHCGKPFTVYGNQKRKYCCHACYVADRFGGGNDEL